MCSDSFKKIFQFLFLFFGVVVFMGCADEEVPYSEPPDMKLGGPGRQCLSTTGETIQQFIEGHLETSELEAYWDCLSEALTTFTEYTKGRESETYKSTEIRNFLARFFLGEVVISDPMLNQVMHIKRVFVGGSASTFSRKEIEETKVFIGDLKRLTALLNPHMSLYYLALQGKGAGYQSIDLDRFERAMKTFHKVTQELSEIIVLQNESYSFSDLEIFLRELFVLIDFEDPRGVDVWLKYLPLLKKGKQILVGGDEEKIQGFEWRQVFSVFAVFFESVSRLSLFVMDSKFGTEDNVIQLQEFFKDFDRVIFDALSLHPGNTITFGILNDFIDVLDELFEFPLGLSASEVKDIFQSTVNYLLTPANVQGKIVEGFTFIHLNEVRKEFFYWSRSQIFADRVSLNPENPPEPKLPAELEFHRAAFGGPWKLILTSRNALQVDWNSEDKYDFASLTQLNWQRTVVRILLLRFAKDQERRDNLTFLTQQELIEAQKAIEPLGVALGLFEPGDTSLVFRIIREASLFMPRSDGDQNVTYEEGLEYLATIMSGLSLQALIFDDLEGICPIEEKDGEVFIDSPCFRRQSAQRMELYMHHLPHLRAYFDVPEKEALWAQFEKFQEETIRTEGYSEKPMRKGDVMEMWILLGYIETFFGRFDRRNPKSTINVGDSLDAYQVYEPYLAILLEGYPLGTGGRRALFTYLMKHGKIHYLDDAIGGAIRFVWWRLNESSWEYEATRMRIVQILASLSQFQNSVFGHKLMSHGTSKPPLR